MSSFCWRNLFLLILFGSISFEKCSSIKTIHIGGLFDFDHPLLNSGQDDFRAAQLAIEEINQRSFEIFNDSYRLVLLSNNSRCDPIYAVDAFFHGIFRRPQLTFLVGTSCSNETKAVIQVADYYNLILFSHSTAFISETNQTTSSLVRLAVSDETYHDARVAFLNSNSWSNVAILHQDSIDYSLMTARLGKRLNESNINVVLTQSASWTNLTAALTSLQGRKARIVFAHFDTSSRARFFCEVFRTFPRKLRERYVWILTGNDYHQWNISISNCSREEILEAARGHIIVDSSYEMAPSLINPKRDQRKLQAELSRNDSLDLQTLQAYDAVWVLAMLIRNSIERKIAVEQFTYNHMNFRDQWLNLLENIHFHGLSGPVSFENRARRAETRLSQFNVEFGRIEIRLIGEFSSRLGFNRNCSSCRPLIWPGSPPVDIERNRIHRVTLSVLEILFLSIGCVFSLALAVFFLTFNVIYRHERYIKLSSPKLNNVLVIGAIHIYIAILLFAFDQWFVEKNFLGHACMLRIFLFSGGFSLTFGSMFLKTLRVYKIFTSNHRPILHSKLLQDHYLLMICSYLYGIDVASAILWEIFDAHYAIYTYGPIRSVDIDTVVTDELYHCDSKYRQKILWIIYLYKSLFLVVGGYLAAKTRHVHIAALNDSKFIVWSIYTVVLTSLFTFLVMISIKNLLTYVFLSFVVILMTTFILCLVFVPKALQLKNRQREDILSKDLYIDQSRTRRLAVEISHFETYRYAQLQNRELKTELLHLNQSLSHLQQKVEGLPANVTIALIPFAVRLASTFLQKTENQSATIIRNPQELIEEACQDDRQSLLTITSSEETLFQFQSASSSELNLTVDLQSLNENSSLSLTALENDNENDLTNDEESLSLTIEQRSSSDEESVLFLRLPDELNIIEATLDSDLERIDRYNF